MEWQVQQIRSFDFEDFERRLAKKIEGEFRGNKRLFDHTLEVVSNVKKIVSREGGKMDVLVTIAYMHELGASKYKGEAGVIYEGKGILEEKCDYCSSRAKELLTELQFPTEKIEKVSSLLGSNTCFELKRAHHSVP